MSARYVNHLTKIKKEKKQLAKVMTEAHQTDLIGNR